MILPLKRNYGYHTPPGAGVNLAGGSGGLSKLSVVDGWPKGARLEVEGREEEEKSGRKKEKVGRKEKEKKKEQKEKEKDQYDV